MNYQFFFCVNANGGIEFLIEMDYLSWNSSYLL